MQKVCMKIALVSAFLDDGYQHILNDEFMEKVVCQEDHFYHRIADSIKMRDHEVTVFYISVEKEIKKFKHKYGHEIIRVPAKKIPFFHEPLVYSPDLIKQIENRVRWRESIVNMVEKGVDHFIEIGPGKVLSGLVKRINKDVKISTINNEIDIESIKI